MKRVQRIGVVDNRIVAGILKSGLREVKTQIGEVEREATRSATINDFAKASHLAS